MIYILILSLLLTACNITPKAPAVHDFGLAVPVANQRLHEPALNVDAPKWLWDKSIRYRLLYKAQTQVNSYALDRWLAAPPELFEQYLSTSLATLDYQLNIKLLEFEQQFTTPTQAKVVLRFYVEAVKNANQKHSTQEFALTQPTNTADAGGAVNGFSNLARQASQQINQWLRQK